VATTGEGVDAVWDAIVAHRGALETSGALVARRHARLREEVRAIALARLAARVDERCRDPEFDAVMARLEARELDPYAAASLLEGDVGPRR
jgi:LAO/AO transport system kinase